MATAIDTNGDYEHMKIEELPTNDEFSEYDDVCCLACYPPDRGSEVMRRVAELQRMRG